MNFLDLTLPAPEANLACDEVLLEWCRAHHPQGMLRVWEPQTYFVVAGYGNQLEREINLDACRKWNVPVYRRMSGGGAVLQGPGCLNYAVLLPLTYARELETVTGTNHFVMERLRMAVQSLMGDPVTIEGFTDLAVRQKKFSGNSQRRLRDFLLFHGSFLLQMDLAWIERLLFPPSRAPEYRAHRNHTEFLTNVNISAPALRQGLCRAWNANNEPMIIPLAKIQTLAREKYGNADWIQSRMAPAKTN
jgi:lipoate-protein ligase A